MQVNLHGSLCITAVFLYCYGYRKNRKRNLAQSLRKYAILTLGCEKKFCGGGSGHCPLPRPSPCGEGVSPSPHLTPLALSAYAISYY